MEAFAWRPKELNENKPLYLAIADALEQDIRCGKVKSGQRLPPQRDLADIIGVNVSTITRMLKECQRRGLTSGTVGSGTYVSTDINVPVSMFDSLTFNSDLMQLGLVKSLTDLDEEIAAQIKKIVAETDLAPLMSYVEPAGLLRHREAAAQWLGNFGLQASPDNVLISAGSQNAMACCLTGLFRPGDHIAVEQYTYPGMKTLAAMLGVRFIPIRMDENGILPEALETACRREPIRGLYVMPEFQNPTTVRLSDERRQRVAAIVKKYSLILLEDDAYRFAGRLDSPPLCALAPEQGVYIAGVSKVFGGGLRVSFMAAAPRLREQVESAIMNTAWMTSPLNAEIACRFILDGKAMELTMKKRAESARRVALARSLLKDYDCRSREQGFFVWLRLPPPWVTGREFELTAAAAGVKVFCAEKFAVGSGPVPPAARISLSGAGNAAELENGLRVLAGILGSQPRRESVF